MANCTFSSNSSDELGSADESDLCQYDVDRDGQINPVDSGIVQSLFGTCEKPRAVCP